MEREKIGSKFHRLSSSRSSLLLLLEQRELFVLQICNRFGFLPLSQEMIRFADLQSPPRSVCFRQALRFADVKPSSRAARALQVLCFANPVTVPSVFGLFPVSSA